jgi:hypothetical protein
MGPSRPRRAPTPWDLDGSIVGPWNVRHGLLEGALVVCRVTMVAWIITIVSLKAYFCGTRWFIATVSYASSWQRQAQTSARIASGYGNDNSWTMAYNLFADKRLNTGLFPGSV